MEQLKGIRLQGGMVSIAAVGVVAPSNAVAGWVLSTGRRAIIRKIMWSNRNPLNSFLMVGYNDLTPAPGGPNFVQVLPDILMLAGFDGELAETDLPICGNTREGFQADTTPVTGTTGNIMLEATVAAAIPNDVQVTLEVEEFGA